MGKESEKCDDDGKNGKSGKDFCGVGEGVSGFVVFERKMC